MRRNKNNICKEEQELNEDKKENIIEIEDKNNKKREITYYTYFLNKTHLFIIYIGNFTVRIIRISISIYGIYLLWIMLHFFASHLYIKFCVPASFVGFIVSPFLTTTPHCQGLRWIIYNGANTINNMWIVIGSWMTSSLLLFTRNIPHENV
jgi:hypothetical protein